MHENIALWCGIGIGVIVAILAALLTFVTWYASLDKPKYIPSRRQDARKRERMLRGAD